MPWSRTPAAGHSRVRAEDLVDVLVYVVILNLAAELVPAVISESFSMSLVTAVILKLVLDVVIAIKGRFRTAATPVGKVAAAVALWAVLVGSKFVVLKIEALVFGTWVSLGGFFSVTAMILVMLVARSGVRRLLGSRGSLS